MFRTTIGVTVDCIEAFRKKLSEANPGDDVGAVFSTLERSQLNRGDLLTAPGLV
jgi:translation elongation factor EF-Tu-like GTPase